MKRRDKRSGGDRRCYSYAMHVPENRITDRRAEADSTVLTFDWHVPDEWYEQNFRILLAVNPHRGFKNAIEAAKYKTLFKKYITKRYAKKYNLKVLCKEMIIGKRESFKDFIYCSNGPSQNWNHINIFTANLEETR